MIRLNLFLFLIILLSVTTTKAQIDTNKNAINYSQQSLQAPLVSNADWLSGSWGVTFPVFGGDRLDSGIAAGGFDPVGGAQELVDELPEVGHIITNLSYFAHSHLFPYNENANVDVAKEIHPNIIPSGTNGQIIFDVLKIFKNSGKKIILYISTNYFDRASDDQQAAWLAYYTKNFEGNQYLAYRDLIQGFIKIVKDYADGYWLDTCGNLTGEGKIEDFIAMIKETDPGAIVTANTGKEYFTINGVTTYVDSDGFDDTNDTVYKIIIYEPIESYQDFTSGHVSPLEQGAPPNSWAYEEFTIPNMIKNPWYNFNGKEVLKHAWFPIRTLWHVPMADLVFGTEQAYRFVKTITDGGASMTFATTVNYGTGHMMADEMAIMKEINRRLQMDPQMDYVPYQRPPGAYYVGEPRANAVLDQGNVWYHNNNPNVSNAVISDFATGIMESGQSTPYTQGNASQYVSKFTRGSGSEAYIRFILPEIINKPSSAIFKIRIYTASNSTLTNNNLKMVLRKDGDTTTQISLTKEVTAMNEWVNYTFDMSGLTFTGEDYNEIYLLFASEDTDDDANGNVYYFDAFQGHGPAPFNLKFIIKDSNNQLLPDVKLSIDSRNESTNNFGEANFTLLMGSYNVTVSKSGFLTKSQTYKFDSDSVIIINLQKSIANVEFRIKDGENIVRYATIKLNSVVQQANSLGIATYYEQSGNKDYTYTVEKTGYQSVRSTFTLSNDTTINIQLNTITDLNEIKENSCRIYPNPAKDNIMIESQKEMAKVNVLGLNGQIVLSQKVSGRKHKLGLPKEICSLLFVNVVFKDGSEITKKISVDSGR